MVKNQIQNRSRERRREVHFVRRICRIDECSCLKHANHFLAATGRHRCDFHHHIANESQFVKLFNRTIQHTFAMHHHSQRAARFHLAQHSLLSRQQLLRWRLTQKLHTNPQLGGSQLIFNANAARFHHVHCDLFLLRSLHG